MPEFYKMAIALEFRKEGLKMSEDHITVPVENSKDLTDSLFDENEHVTEEKGFKVDLSNAVKVAKKQREAQEVIAMDINELFGDNVSFVPVDTSTKKSTVKPNKNKFK